MFLHLFLSTDHPQPPVCKLELLLDEQHCKLEDNSSLSLEVPQIKEEQDELCTSREREQPLVQEEEDVFRLTPDGSDHSDHQSQHSELCQTWSAEEEEPVGNISFKLTQSEADGEGSGVSNSERRFRSHSHRVAESEGSKPSSCGSAGSAQSTEPQQQSRAPEIDSCSKECRVCGKGFKVLSVFKEHVRTHTKPFSCSTCEKVFSFKGNLKRHMMTHTGERPYSCTTCDKTFIRHSHLKAHMMTHTGEKPYSCTTCDKTFILHSLLKRHITEPQQQSRAPEHDSCSKEFSDMKKLQTYPGNHTGKEFLRCRVCGKGFKVLSVFKEHVRIHTKLFSCSTCGKVFSFKGNLKRHMMIHTGERPYSPLIESLINSRRSLNLA
uniref:C2H2-type domain-containing protein n=1 Tax=Myripristis murdjan TaxID=586833 RepID=A0A667X104_9TELE